MALEWQGLKSKLGLRPQTGSREIGTGPGVKCENCGEMLMRVDFEANLRVCGGCRHHHVLGAADRLRATLDDGTFEELDGGLATLDILEFKGMEPYSAKLAKAKASTSLSDAMLSGTGRLKGRRIAIGATDSRFLAGSMGSVMGERFVRLVEGAAARKLPVVVFSGSGGGARMYEGLFSLMQMAKTSAALNLLDQAR
ncbi:MAG: acetyl-CoA carboxylase carboxyl transferase subunit beta, partial [Planctomycetota bacterium]|nr:acetyl-CoA carboxylase carboxyl transferase subunit beta [Planctomycetota bacterium]